jgi:hypothetical protein
MALATDAQIMTDLAYFQEVCKEFKDTFKPEQVTDEVIRLGDELYKDKNFSFLRDIMSALNDIASAGRDIKRARARLVEVTEGESY